MKVLYMVYFDLENTKFLGVKKKIYGQINGLRKLGFQVDVAYCSKNKLIIRNEEKRNEIDIKKGLTNYRRGIYKLFKKNSGGYNIFYFRFPGSIDYYLYSTFKWLSRNNKIIMLEIPTYPIGGELLNYLRKLRESRRYIMFLFKGFIFGLHRLFSRKIHKYVHRAVTFMPVEKIWGINTVSIENGIDIESFASVANGYEKKQTQQFNLTLLGVANVSTWHGYDRLIKGIHNYYNSKSNIGTDITFNIIGEGDELSHLKWIVKKFNLEDKVKFLGMREGDELYKSYLEADIGVASLGMHRIGLNVGSSIKSKEYCAYGIPFIYSYKERIFDDDFPFALKLPGNDDDIDINLVIDFYKEVQRVPDYRNKMHLFAKENFDWIIQMKKVIDNI